MLPIVIRREPDRHAVRIPRIRLADTHEPLRIHKRQRRQQHPANRTDDTRRRAEAEGEREDDEKLAGGVAAKGAEHERVLLAIAVPEQTTEKRAARARENGTAVFGGGHPSNAFYSSFARVRSREEDLCALLPTPSICEEPRRRS